MKDLVLASLEQAQNENERTWIITRSLLDALPKNLAEAVLGAAVPHWFNISVLGAVLQISDSESEIIYSKLQELSFVEGFGNLGHTLHDLTRSAIINHLVNTQPEIFHTFSKLAFEYFHQFDDSQRTAEAVYHLLVIQ